MLQTVIKLLTFLVCKYCVTLRECSTFDVLTCHADIVALRRETEEGKRFTACPVQRVALKRFDSLVDMVLFYTRMHFEAIWE